MAPVARETGPQDVAALETANHTPKAPKAPKGSGSGPRRPLRPFSFDLSTHLGRLQALNDLANGLASGDIGRGEATGATWIVTQAAEIDRKVGGTGPKPALPGPKAKPPTLGGAESGASGSFEERMKAAGRL